MRCLQHRGSSHFFYSIIRDNEFLMQPLCLLNGENAILRQMRSVVFQVYLENWFKCLSPILNFLGLFKIRLHIFLQLGLQTLVFLQNLACLARQHFLQAAFLAVTICTNVNHWRFLIRTLGECQSSFGFARQSSSSNQTRFCSWSQRTYCLFRGNALHQLDGNGK